MALNRVQNGIIINIASKASNDEFVTSMLATDWRRNFLVNDYID